MISHAMRKNDVRSVQRHRRICGTVDTLLLVQIKLIAVFVVLIATGFEIQELTFFWVENIPNMHQFINNAPDNMEIARF